MREPTALLIRDQIDFFHREGYLVLTPITTAEEVAYLREIFDIIFNQKIGWNEGDQFDLAGREEEGRQAVLPQIEKPSRYVPELKGTLYLLNSEAIARQLFGDEITQLGEHMILKPAKIGPETPWHQDQAYWDPGFLYRTVSFWMPLQEATIENGCLHFVPGSHKGSHVYPHHPINYDPRIHGLEMDNPKRVTKHSVACPVPAVAPHCTTATCSTLPDRIGRNHREERIPWTTVSHR